MIFFKDFLMFNVSSLPGIGGEKAVPNLSVFRDQYLLSSMLKFVQFTKLTLYSVCIKWSFNSYTKIQR